MSTSNRNPNKFLVTGGAGFIGSHAIRQILEDFPEAQVVNLDLLTYAGNLENLTDIESKKNYSFVQMDIRDKDSLNELFKEHQFDCVVHLAAESHVDRSIEQPSDFITTNILGTYNLLEVARQHWSTNLEGKLFYHISTDEVYGSLGNEGFFTEETSYDPRSPYSASKASSDHLVNAYSHTFNLPVVLSNCSNNYGPNQFPEKLIPLMVMKAKAGEQLPVYGNGTNVRDWLYVKDHATAMTALIKNGKLGESYNIGGNNEWTNLDLVHLLCEKVDRLTGLENGTCKKSISFVKDRAGHDYRYAIDASKIKSHIGWTPEKTFEQGLEETIKWYLDNDEWINNVLSGTHNTK